MKYNSKKTWLNFSIIMESETCKKIDKRYKDVKKTRDSNDKKKSLRKKKRKGYHGTPGPGRGKVLVPATSSVVEITNDNTECTECELPTPSTSMDVDPTPVEGGNIVSVMEKKVRAPIEIPMLVDDEEKEEVRDANGYKIINSDILQELIDSVSKCPNCQAEKCLVVKQNDPKRRGLCEQIQLHCLSCRKIVKSIQTSKKVVGNSTQSGRMIDVNLRSVIAATSIGGGLTTLRRLCFDFNSPPPVTEHPYNEYLKHFEMY